MLVWAASSFAEVDIATASGVWLFDDEADVATDSSPNGNNGDLFKAPGYVAGRFGKAIELNGSNQFAWVRNPVGLPTGAAPRTVMLWFKWSEVKWPNPGIEPMGYGTNANGNRVGMWISSGKGVGVETCNWGETFPWDGDLDWHHLAVAYPEGETLTDAFKVYFDGEPQETSSGAPQTITTTAGPLTIGVLPAALVYFFNGLIDEVAVFPTELSPDDIAAIARSGLEAAQAVSPAGKLATAWGHVKAL